MAHTPDPTRVCVTCGQPVDGPDILDVLKPVLDQHADLLAALENIIEELPGNTNDCGWMDDGLRRAVESARAVITKVEGG